MAKNDGMTCLLGKDPMKDQLCSASACYRCGWEKKEHERRKMLIRMNGLTHKPDGTMGLLIDDIPSKQKVDGQDLECDFV